MEFDKDLRSIQEVRDLLTQARRAQNALAAMSQEDLDRITAAISAVGAEHAARLAAMAAEETGFGKKEDKEIKNRFAAVTLYEAIRDQKTHGILHEDREHRTVDIGVPVGVVAGLVPSTNPTSTVIYKAMICLKAGNPIIFSPHPSAVGCILETVKVIRQAAERAGAPTGSISCITTPTIEATNTLMRHDITRLILATGGAAMVKAAYSSGTPAIGVGAGNGPAYIHHTANVEQAVKRILDSKTFDNGTICASEQSVIMEARMEPAVKAALRSQGAYLLDEEETRQLSRFILRANGTMNPAIVGKSVETVAKLAGLSRVPASARVLVARETGVGKGHPYSSEKLGLILACYVEPDEEAVLRRCVEILEWEGAGHTFAIHTEDEAVAKKFAAVPASRVLVNTPASLGGIGATTCLFPALTLGCGAVGGSSSSNNIGPLDLINIKRVAWGVKELEQLRGQAGSASPYTVDDSLLDRLVEQIMGRLK
ncbi:acetaldehyde dehydrogenase (acetylating) [Pseudoflavonifractor phocaeensis]|uniref:acetaldehyde dehydrogenase (acetylating) n=1 Tax=Pseudoflavonifractor phocaeensis TaxID=1870988 RepID=UPI00195BE96C|nr:acetaldehyde dehydrogenase (acetylating) [Pseudoflavonifractor phocaeensis]MBM6724151.1 acetaldehyde dehydrogenase (acetylating) [Pseudoflavonifractor phocaeensis]